MSHIHELNELAARKDEIETVLFLVTQMRDANLARQQGIHDAAVIEGASVALASVSAQLNARVESIVARIRELQTDSNAEDREAFRILSEKAIR